MAKKEKELSQRQLEKLFKQMISHRRTVYTLKKSLGYHYPKGREIVKNEVLVNGKVTSTEYGIMYFEPIKLDPEIVKANIAKKRIPKCNQP